MQKVSFSFNHSVWMEDKQYLHIDRVLKALFVEH